MKRTQFFRGWPLILLRFLSMVLCLGQILPFTLTPAMAASGGVTNNSGFIPFQQGYFAFEVEDPLSTLKDVTTWHEVEQVLDNPYAFALDPNTAGNKQGWPAYRTTITRRKSFLPHGCTYDAAVAGPNLPLCNDALLPQFLIHPLNYNESTGEELRLLNIDFPATPWNVAYQLLPTAEDSSTLNCWAPGAPPVFGPCPAATQVYRWTYTPVLVSAGVDRIEDDEVAPDFNSPIAPDVTDANAVCIISVDQFFTGLPGPIFSAGPASGGTAIAEGSIVCGGDPGEPNYAGFGSIDPTQYSTSAVPGKTGPTHVLSPGGVDRLWDPVRGFIDPRNAVTGVGGLRKPSIRITDAGLGLLGTGSNPHYTVNTDPNSVLPSNENDYIRGATFAEKQAARDEAAALGKALFWDMQVGSDGVQACGSCHFHAGADNRTKNQLNPNHLGGDITSISVAGTPNVTGANQEVNPSHFPLHKLTNNTIPGEPLLNPGNVISDTNDVMSSMGVVFRRFLDVTIGAATAFFTDPITGIKSLLPDLGAPDPDPVPVFQGVRRVEPRNTPTFFASAMNFDNFWDGRARHDFNGGSVFGPADPENHVFVNNGTPAGSLTATRQIIRFSSLASLSTGPALSNFEMSFDGRNWAKIAKKLLQPGVTPLANQLVDTTDSLLGIYSNQGGSACAGLPVADRSGNGLTAFGKPGLCISYPAMIRRSFYPHLWASTTQHLNGAPSGDPFDFYTLMIASGPSAPANTNQFTQMEANMPLFFGLAIQTWGNIVIPDDTPFDQFMDDNPSAHASFGESGEPFLVLDLVNCSDNGNVEPCFREVGNFKRDPDVDARINCTLEGGGDCTIVPSGGTRQPGQPDPLVGLDFFLGSNLSLKNPNFRSLRCGECHAGGNLTDHTFATSHQVEFIDRIPEFVPGMPGIELFPEDLGKGRIASPFLLEGELQENAQDGLERNIADFCTAEPCVDANGNPIPGGVNGGFPQGQALFDNGMYNIGVRPISEDVSRGGLDPFGWPLSLSYLALKNLCGVDYSPGGDDPLNGFAQPPYPGIPCPNFDPAIDPTGGGLLDPTAQDQQINPGFAEEPATPLLPPHLAPWANNINVGDESNIDEVFIGINTVMAEPMLEGFVDAWGPFNPAAIVGESFNNARQPEMATWPNVNRVNVQGAFKAPPLRNVELTGPYFHNGGKLTLRQQLDFYMRGGDFPKTNAAHRDFLLANLRLEDEALGGCLDSTAVVAPGLPLPPLPCDQPGAVPEFSEAEKEAIIVSMVDFLLELTDDRVRFEQAPFDHPELFLPLDGTASDNTFGRPGFMANIANGMFRQVLAVGAAGNAAPLPGFLGVSNDCTIGNCQFDSDTINPPGMSVTVSKTADLGLVQSVQPGIYCGTDCTEIYPQGTVLVLLAMDPDGCTSFDSWGGACAGTQTTCSVTMDTIKTVSAFFSPTNPFDVNGTPYSTFALAYAAANPGVLKARAMDMPPGDILVDKPLTLVGGYTDCGFTVIASTTTISGNLTVGAGGILTVENVVIAN